MRKTVCLSVILSLISIINSEKSLAQTIDRDSSSQQNAFKNAVTLYFSALGKQAGIFNGIEYNLGDPLIKGNAFFSDVNTFTPGSVYYDDVYYDDVPMLYDINTDQVVALLYDHYSMYSLIKEKVGSFNLLNHHFIYINSDTSAEKAGLKPGFYDQLYPGRTEILVKRQKTIQTSNSADSYFSDGTKWFLKKNNVFYSFGNKGALLQLLKDKKKELKQYINTNQIKFRDKPEEEMVKIVSFYDHLTN